METPTIKTRISELKSQVNPYSTNTKFKNMGFFSLESLYKGYRIYIIIPVIILLLLVISRPSFIYLTTTDKDGNEILKFSYNKLLISWLVICSLLSIGIYGFNYKMNLN
jgi:hypothetical protein